VILLLAVTFIPMSIQFHEDAVSALMFSYAGLATMLSVLAW